MARIEFPCRPLAEHELWAADLAFISQARYTRIRRWLIGSTELVIEVKSPSNTQSEMHDRAMTALAGGAQECWIVDPEMGSITVYTPAAGIQIYSGDSAAPLTMLNGEIAIEQLFRDLDQAHLVARAATHRLDIYPTSHV